MGDIHPARSDVEELAHRRRLAAGRQSRNTEREALLQKLLETERKALELHSWVVQWEMKKEAASPEIRRLLEWAKETLLDMERFLLPTELTKLLETRDLFPDVDDLAESAGRSAAASSVGPLTGNHGNRKLAMPVAGGLGLTYTWQVVEAAGVIRERNTPRLGTVLVG